MTDDTSKADFFQFALDRYERPLVRYATGILGDVERAREVVQDTYLRLCKEKTARVRDHLAQWLFTVCRNRAFDVRSKESRMSPLNDSDLDTRPGPGPRPLAILEQKETLGQVLDLVESLPVKEREVLTLKFRCDLSYKEISSITNLSVSNVGFLIHRGVTRIREQVENDRPPAPSLVRRLP